jgi:hypothetical protein
MRIRGKAKLLIAAATAAIGLLNCCASTSAATLNPGDLLVTDSQASNYHGLIVDVNPITGAQTLVASGGDIVQPTGLCMDSDGSIVVADYGGSFPGDNGSIYRINPLTGQQTMITSGGSLALPTSINFDHQGNLIVTQQGQNQAAGAILKINPSTGAQTVVASGQFLNEPENVVIGTDGNYFVSQFQPSDVIEVNATTGAQTELSSGGLFNAGLSGLSFDQSKSNSLLVSKVNNSDPSSSALLELNIDNGDQSLVSTVGDFSRPLGIAQDGLGETYVTDAGPFTSPTGSILEIDLQTGAQSVISSGNMLVTPRTIIVIAPEPASLALLAIAGLATLRRRSRIS